MSTLQKSQRRESQRAKARYGMRGNGVGADRRPVAVRTDSGLPKRLVRLKS